MMRSNNWILENVVYRCLPVNAGLRSKKSLRKAFLVKPLYTLLNSKLATEI